MYDYQVIVLISVLSTGLCLQCHRCYYATDPTLCRHHTTCFPGQSCGKQTFKDYSGLHYDLDCVDTSSCRHVAIAHESVGVFGRRRAVSEIVCCHTDLCNKNMSHPAEQGTTTKSTIITPTDLLTAITIPPSTISEVHPSTTDTCTDHEDCDILTQSFNACNDSDIATIVCRKSCGMCDVTTTRPLCVDTHPDCQILSDHLNVCENDNFARTRCPWTCGVCESHSTSTTSSSVISTTDSDKSGLCEDGHDCDLLKELNICKNPLTAQLCPVYCGICQNSTQTSTTVSTPLSQTTETMVNISTPSISSTETAAQTTKPTTAQTTELTTEATSTVVTPCRDTLPSNDCQRILTDTSTACSEKGTQTVCKLTCNLCGNVTKATTVNSTSNGDSSLDTTTSVIQNSHKTTVGTGERTTNRISTRITTPATQPSRTTTVSEVGVVVVG